jgi:hypothetical protein
MTTFSVVVQAHEQMRSETHFETFEEAEWFARDTSATGAGVEWTEVWDVPPSGNRKDGRKLRRYEFGERMNRVTGLPWSDDQTLEG